MRLVFSCFLICCLTQAQAGQEKPIKQIVVSGARTDVEVGRDFVAGKIIIGKQRIAESGLQNVGELLGREPSISVGKDGRIGLLGLPGYTQVLVDGIPPQSDSFALDLVHVERIEIIKSSTAATGPVGIAGTINIVRRKTDRKTMTQLRGGLGAEGGRFGGDLAWSTNQAAADGPFSYHLRLSALRKPVKTRRDYTQQRQSSTGAASSEAEGRLVGDGEVQVITASGELAWALNPKHKFSISPELGRTTDSYRSLEERLWSIGASTRVRQEKDGPMWIYSLPLRWDWRAGSDSHFSARLNLSRSVADNRRISAERPDDVGARQREHLDTRDNRNYFLNLDANTASANGHEISVGAKFSRNDSLMSYQDFDDGDMDDILAALGRHGATRMDSAQLFMQDEWRINRTWALNAGLSVEHRSYRLDEGMAKQSSSFNMWAPSLHASKRFGEARRNQFRFSVARSFRPPYAGDMLERPLINPLAPCVSRQLCGANTIDTPDSSGNAGLRPERAIGLNLSYSHGIGRNSELLVELYSRAIDNKTGSEIVLGQVAWASAPRYLYRPANLGDAQIQGVNLEARVSGKDAWPSLPELNLHGSLGLTQSRLDDIAGPDNSVEGQSPLRAKFGGGYRSQSLPLKLGFDLSYLPGDWWRDNTSQRVFESSKLTAGASASWDINKNTRVILNLDNLVPRNRRRTDEYSQNGGLLRRLSTSDESARISLRFEKTL